jgi:hypothetical protein
MTDCTWFDNDDVDFNKTMKYIHYSPLLLKLKTILLNYKTDIVMYIIIMSNVQKKNNTQFALYSQNNIYENFSCSLSCSVWRDRSSSKRNTNNLMKEKDLFVACTQTTTHDRWKRKWETGVRAFSCISDGHLNFEQRIHQLGNNRKEKNFFFFSLLRPSN